MRLGRGIERESRTNRGREQAEAAAAGATAGAIAALVISFGLGHELDLPKGAKLELELGRALYLVKE